jgi:hypothetical protein
MTDQILWFALLMSHGTYAFILHVVTSQREAAGSTDTSMMLPLAGAALALGIAALAVDAVALGEAQIEKWIAQEQAQGKQAAALSDAVAGRVFTMSILRWALADGVSIVGLLAALNQWAARNQALLFIALGAAVHLYCRPKMARIQAQVAERIGSGIAP